MAVTAWSCAGVSWVGWHVLCAHAVFGDYSRVGAKACPPTCRVGNFIAFLRPSQRDKFLDGLQRAWGKRGNVAAQKRAGLFQGLQQFAFDDGTSGQSIDFKRETRLGQTVANRFGARNRFGLAQGNRQGIENDFAQRVVIVIGAEAQQPEYFF